MKSKTREKKQIIILIEKEEDLRNLQSLNKYFSETSWTLIALESRKILLKTVNEKKPDLFLIDLDQSQIDGLSLCREIHSNPDFHFTPIILLTSDYNYEKMNEYKKAGAADFISKNCDKQELICRIRMHLNSRDVTSELQKKLIMQSEAIQLNKDRFHILFELSNDAIFVIDTQSGYYLDANKAAEILTGRSVEEIKLLKTKDLAPQGSHELLKMARNAKTGFQMGEVEYRRPDGEIRTANLTLVPIEGTLAFGIAHDITDMKRILSEAEEKQAWNVSILDNTADSLWALDKNFEMIYANKQFLDVNAVLFGKAPKKGDNLVTGMPEWKKDTWIDRYERAFSGEVLSFEESFPNPFQPKQMFYMQYRINPLYLGDEIVGATVYGTDMTEKRQHEEIIQKMDRLQSIGTLAGGIAHDFNNLLTALYGNLSLAKLSVNKKDASYTYLEAAEESMDRATSLTRQLLTFSKGGAPQKEELSVKDTVEEILKLDLSGSNVKALLESPENLWPVMGDRGQLQQVISNIVINGIQSMPEGGELKIKLENQPLLEDHADLPSGGYVKIIIEDQGCGIPRNDLLRIFDPYFSTKEKGSGLGLSTAFSIVNRHQGRISVDSEKGKGSTFSIWLPTPSESTSVDGFTPEKEKKSIKKGDTKTVLLMEDEELIQKSAGELLEKLGYRVTIVNEGMEAIGAYKKAINQGKRFDLVILDLTIPGGMGGSEAIKGILALDSKAFCFVSSGYNDDEVMANYRHYGFSGKINKPYTFENLKALLLDKIPQKKPAI